MLPVWLLLAPRDYLSTFMKVGTIVLLALGILISMPTVQMPALTQFGRDGTGPAFAGSLFPFLFITIACGALSGFHALISSGTTPKLIEKESQARMIGYGSMLTESFVAIMALVAAVSIDQHIYFAMNAPAALTGGTPEAAAEYVNGLGLMGPGGAALQNIDEIAARVLVPLRDHVRGALHPDHRRRGHPRGAVHVLRRHRQHPGARPVQGPVLASRRLDLLPDRCRRLGLHPADGRQGPPRRDLPS